MEAIRGIEERGGKEMGGEFLDYRAAYRPGYQKKKLKGSKGGAEGRKPLIQEESRGGANGVDGEDGQE